MTELQLAVIGEDLGTYAHRFALARLITWWRAGFRFATESVLAIGHACGELRGRTFSPKIAKEALATRARLYAQMLGPVEPWLWGRWCLARGTDPTDEYFPWNS